MNKPNTIRWALSAMMVLALTTLAQAQVSDAPERFDPSRLLPVQIAQAPVQAVAPRAAGVKILGTMILGKTGYVVTQNRKLAVGDVVDGLRIVSVGLDSVTFESAGRRINLDLAVGPWTTAELAPVQVAHAD